MSNFKKLKNLYQNSKFETLALEKDGVYWLKLQSIARKELMLAFCAKFNLDCDKINGSKLHEHIYNLKPEEAKINDFISETHSRNRALRKSGEVKLISELYKMKELDWGGIYGNNLDKTIINNYVKKINDFDILNEKIEAEIHASMRGYVQSSWYNHWTSILIEDIFKDHNKVTPTVGLIKKVDFFIANIPFDLKVTYFPEGYMLACRKSLGLPNELQVLKRFAKEKDIKYDKNQRDKALLSELLTRISERPDPESKRFAKEFRDTRWSIVEQAVREKSGLIKWLYEEQGELRFDAANRLFLILIDKENMEDSWKMKRSVELLNETVTKYLDEFDSRNVDKLKVTFDWKEETYNATADAIFVTK